MDVNKIMTESFDMLLNRDKNLNQIVSDSANLRNDSKDVSKLNNLPEILAVKEEIQELKDGILVQEVYDSNHHLLCYIHSHRIEALSLLNID